jgi:hypothetical protein
LEKFHTREIAIMRKDPAKPGSIVNTPSSLVRGFKRMVRGRSSNEPETQTANASRRKVH